MEPIDFDDLIEALDNPENLYDYQSRPLTILGGSCPEKELLNFLKAWPIPTDTMPYSLWEEISEIKLEKGTLPQHPAQLERGRVFGAGGDLSLRRDGDRFRWWFIGPAGLTAPAGYGKVENFWEKHPQTLLHCDEERALLWGKWAGQEKNQDFWWEDRVAKANLSYPGLDQSPERVQIRFWSFTNAGQVMFVWLQELEEYNG